MTNDTLSAEEIKTFSGFATDACEYFKPEEMRKALNTIEARDKEIEALKGQVAALADKAKSSRVECMECGGEGTLTDRNGDMYDSSSYYDYDCPACGWLTPILTQTQATAEAFIAKERVYEREKTIREVLALDVHEFEGPCYPNDPAILVEDIEALLTKEQA